MKNLLKRTIPILLTAVILCGFYVPAAVAFTSVDFTRIVSISGAGLPSTQETFRIPNMPMHPTTNREHHVDGDFVVTVRTGQAASLRVTLDANAINREDLTIESRSSGFGSMIHQITIRNVKNYIVENPSFAYHQFRVVAEHPDFWNNQTSANTLLVRPRGATQLPAPNVSYDSQNHWLVGLTQNMQLSIFTNDWSDWLQPTGNTLNIYPYLCSSRETQFHIRYSGNPPSDAQIISIPPLPSAPSNLSMQWFNNQPALFGLQVGNHYHLSLDSNFNYFMSFTAEQPAVLLSGLDLTPGSVLFVRSAASALATSSAWASVVVPSISQNQPPNAVYSHLYHWLTGLTASMAFRFNSGGEWSNWFAPHGPTVNLYPFLSASSATQIQIVYQSDWGAVQTIVVLPLEDAPVGLFAAWYMGEPVIGGFEVGNYYAVSLNSNFNSFGELIASSPGHFLYPNVISETANLQPGDTIYVRTGRNPPINVFNTPSSAYIALTLPQHTAFVMFISDCDNIIPSIIVNVGDTAEKPETPEREGYEFKYWTDESGLEFDFNTPITEDIVLAAVWGAISTTSPNFQGDGTASSPFLIRTPEDLALMAELVNSGAVVNGGFSARSQISKLFSELEQLEMNFNSETEAWRMSLSTNSANTQNTSDLITDITDNIISETMLSAESVANQLVPLIEQLSEYELTYANAHYKLVNNIDLSNYGTNFNGGKGWIPIGNSGTNFDFHDGSFFSGTFDGSGNTISGLYINDPSTNNRGLFGVLLGGTIKNLAVEGSVTGGFSVGGIVGLVFQGDIINCASYVTTSGFQAIGGIAGRIGVIGAPIHSGTISNSYSAGSISGNSDAGGIAGRNRWGIISNSYATGAVEGFWYAGGIAGWNDNGEIINSAALNPSVTGENEEWFYGRIVGFNMRFHSSIPSHLSNNIAFNDMLIDKSSLDIGHDRVDGADITLEEINSDGTLGGRFTEANGWTIENGKLPGLFGAARAKQLIKRN